MFPLNFLGESEKDDINSLNVWYNPLVKPSGLGFFFVERFLINLLLAYLDFLFYHYLVFVGCRFIRIHAFFSCSISCNVFFFFNIILFFWVLFLLVYLKVVSLVNLVKALTVNFVNPFSCFPVSSVIELFWSLFTSFC